MVFLWLLPIGNEDDTNALHYVVCAVRRVSIVGGGEQNRDYYSIASACKMDIVVVVVAVAAIVVTSQSIRFGASSSVLDVACPVSTAIYHDFRHRQSSSILRYLPSITICFGFEGRPPPTCSNCELILPFRRRRRFFFWCAVFLSIRHHTRPLIGGMLVLSYVVSLETYIFLVLVLVLVVFACPFFPIVSFRYCCVERVCGFWCDR